MRKSNLFIQIILCIMGVMEHINIRSNQIGVEKNENCKFTALQVLSLLMLFPFFVVKNANRYSNSSLGKLFNCDKDMFYRFMNNGNVKWRKLTVCNEPSVDKEDFKQHNCLS